MKYEGFSFRQLHVIMKNNPKDKIVKKEIMKRISLAEDKTFVSLYSYIIISLIFLLASLAYLEVLLILAFPFCLLIGFELSDLEDKFYINSLKKRIKDM